MRRSCASMATTQLCLRHDFYSRRWPTQAPSDMLKSKQINQTISACVLAAAIGGIGPSVDGAGGLGAGSAGSRRGFRRNHFLRAVKPFSVTRKAGRNGPRAASAVIGQTMRFDHVRVVEPDLPRVLQSPLGRDPTAVFGRLVLLSQKVALQGWLESVKRRDSRWHWGLRWVVDDLERVNRDLRRMSRGL